MIRDTRPPIFGLQFHNRPGGTRDFRPLLLDRNGETRSHRGL